MKKKLKVAPFWNKGWTHCQAIQNVFPPGWPMIWEENGNNFLAGVFNDSSTNEDTGLCCSDEEDEGEEPIPWVSQAICLINSSSHVCPQEQTPPCEAPVQQSPT